MGSIRIAAAMLGLMAGLTSGTAGAAAPAMQPPTWAFAANAPASAPAPRVTTAAQPAVTPDPNAIRQVPGSHVQFTAAQIRNLFAVPDWFPDAHPPLPPVVAAGRRPRVMACGYCHLPNGQGRPENAPLAGLPAAYIATQISDFRSGKRLAAAPVSGPLALMVRIASNVDDADVSAAAAYFSQLHYQPWIKVIETKSVPRTRVVGSMFQPIPGAGMEPLGRRIIEVPMDVERTELRDSSSGFIAYVPPGSVRRGSKLVHTGDNGRTVPCSICHGPDLRGLGGVPPIAGRSPSYLMRQLYDIRHGTRRGLAAELMREPTARLTDDDMLSIVAYVASLPP